MQNTGPALSAIDRKTEIKKYELADVIEKLKNKFGSDNFFL